MRVLKNNIISICLVSIGLTILTLIIRDYFELNGSDCYIMGILVGSVMTRWGGHLADKENK